MIGAMPPHTVVIAPDSFKGTASATEVALALARGWRTERPDDVVVPMPMADGGEGTLDAFEIAVVGSKRMPVTVTGPDDRKVRTSWLLLPDGTGVVELAATSGITLLDPLRPMTAHTRGFGEAIAAALDHGVPRLVLAIGGSSSTDGGVGALSVLGARFTVAGGAPVGFAGGSVGLDELATVDLAGLRPLPPGGVTVLSDVGSPLLGKDGAAAVFGPQKGADATDITVLEAGLARLASFLDVDSGLPGTGAAGGCGYGLVAWGAGLLAGAEAVGDVVGLPAAAASARVIITGEGRFDGQSSAGKVPSYVRGLAGFAGGPGVLLVAGAITAEPVGFAAAVSLTDLSGSSAAAMCDALYWLERAGAALARSVHHSGP